MRITLPTCASRPFVAAAFVGLLTPLVACTAATSAESSGTTAAGTVAAAETVTADAATDATPARGPGHPGDPDFLLAAALHESIGLTVDQEKTVQGLVTTASAGHHPFDKARAAALAAGIRAGKVNVSAAPPRAPTDRAARQAALVNSLDTLHATLTATQRRALVDAIEKRDAEHAAKSDTDGPPAGHSPTDQLLEGIDVTAEQKQEIETKLAATRRAPPNERDLADRKAKHETFRAAMKAKLETFASESFDSAAFVSPPAGDTKPAAAKPMDHPDHFASDLAIIVSVLNPSQREKLAERVEAGPPAGGDHAPPR